MLPQMKLPRKKLRQQMLPQMTQQLPQNPADAVPSSAAVP
jgi:hypothetical protein